MQGTNESISTQCMLRACNAFDFVYLSLAITCGGSGSRLKIKKKLKFIIENVISFSILFLEQSDRFLQEKKTQNTHLYSHYVVFCTKLLR